jgi:hypothetical protein
MSQRVRRICGVFSPIKIILVLLLISLFSCNKQQDALDKRVLQPGTKCNIYAGVFAAGDPQPVAPVTVTSVYRTANSGMIYYNVTDANGVVWQLPDNDLQVMQ